VDRAGHVIHTAETRTRREFFVTAKRQLGRLGMRRVDNVVFSIRETVVRTRVGWH
jgi:hypothetical protein